MWTATVAFHVRDQVFVSRLSNTALNDLTLDDLWMNMAKVKPEAVQFVLKSGTQKKPVRRGKSRILPEGLSPRVATREQHNPGCRREDKNQLKILSDGGCQLRTRATPILVLLHILGSEKSN